MPVPGFWVGCRQNIRFFSRQFGSHQRSQDTASVLGFPHARLAAMPKRRKRLVQKPLPFTRGNLFEQTPRNASSRFVGSLLPKIDGAKSAPRTAETKRKGRALMDFVTPDEYRADGKTKKRLPFGASGGAGGISSATTSPFTSATSPPPDATTASRTLVEESPCQSIDTPSGPGSRMARGRASALKSPVSAFDLNVSGGSSCSGDEAAAGFGSQSSAWRARSPPPLITSPTSGLEFFGRNSVRNTPTARPTLRRSNPAVERPRPPRPVRRTDSNHSDSSGFAIPAQPSSQLRRRRGAPGASNDTSFTFRFSQEKRKFEALRISSQPAASSQRSTAFGSQGLDFCTPVDAGIQERTVSQHAEALEISRVPAKRPRCSTTGAGAAAHIPAGAEFFQITIPQCSDNKFLPPAGTPLGRLDTHKKRASPPPINKPSHFVENFERIETIGKGCFGTVIKCRHRVDGCVYVIKNIRKPITGTCKRNEILNEAFAMSSLAAYPRAPPSIVRYFSSWVEDSNLYLQLEFCSNGSLAAKIKNGNRFQKATEVLKVCLAMARALEFLHVVAGIAHLDIKPDNILEASPGEYKLGDFGLATHIDRNHSVQELSFAGDKRYLPPEVLAKSEVDLQKVDIFALGMTAFELACKTKPDPLRWSRVQTGACPSLGDAKTVSGNRTAALENLINRLVAQQASARPSAPDIVQHLQDKLQGNFGAAERARLQKQVADLTQELRESKRKQQHMMEEMGSVGWG